MGLYLIVNEDAPGYSQGYVEIEASFKNVPVAPIRSYKHVFNLSFTPGYFPSINVDLPDVNTVEINPEEVAVFPIKVENLGNEETVVFFKVESLPDGWSATVTDEVLLGKNGSGEAKLVVKPSKDFGYHEEKGIVRVSAVPARALDISERGDEMMLTFLVKNRGFATPGFELIYFIPAFMVLIVLIRRRRDGFLGH